MVAAVAVARPEGLPTALSTSLSQKTKNSDKKNKDRTNVAGVIVKLCESFKDGGTAHNNEDSTRQMMNVMMMNQMTLMRACMEYPMLNYKFYWVLYI